MKIALLGYGKMGKAIEEIALERGHQIVLKVNSQNLNQLTDSNLKKADVAIEFSTPTQVISNITLCLNAGIPIAVGTTGWYESKKEIYQQVENLKGTFLAASNFSIGVNIFFELNKKLAKLMSKQNDYKPIIEEIHHTEKLDSPSGTAITLAEGVLEKQNNYKTWVNEPNDSDHLLEIKSFRKPNVPGTHEIIYTSDIDIISIKHEAKNRKGFALGAIIAAEFIHSKKGIFSMEDVLKN